MTLPFGNLLSLLTEHLGRQKLRVSVLTAAILCNAGLRLANPQLIRVFIDRARALEPLGTLHTIGLGCIVLMVVQQVVSVLVTYFGTLVGWTSTNELRARLLEHTVRLDMTFHNRHTPGEMIERIDGDITLLGNFFSEFAIQILANLILIAGAVMLIWLAEWRAGLAILGFVVVAFVVILRLRNIAVPHWKRSREASADCYGFPEEHLAATEAMRTSIA